MLENVHYYYTNATMYKKYADVNIAVYRQMCCKMKNRDATGFNSIHFKY